jgi:hypothetical protein
MSSATGVRLLDDLQHCDAMTLLKGNSARTFPGATSNLRNAVYFYASKYGSRVFFGSAMAEAPCTDNHLEPVSPAARPDPTHARCRN